MGFEFDGVQLPESYKSRPELLALILRARNGDDPAIQALGATQTEVRDVNDNIWFVYTELPGF